jgi:RHS repeat-associated protein
VQDVGFNYWNKMSSVWATDENNFYSYSVDYGPDLRRVSSEMHRTYQKLYEKFYWDDYEEKVEGSDTLRYYYLNGANGLEALHIVKTSPNAQPVSQTTKVVTDHLGSITALIDESDYAYIARYDAWGNRENVMPFWFDLTFDRGYTGHEHLEMLGLINMNGRMYDPLLGRFLSPDPYIQAPTDPQNFNRYSYCLNNPLKYTDPDGEKISWLWGVAAAMGFIPLESMVALATVITADATTASICAAIGGDDIDGISKRVYNSVKISTAMLQSDELDGNEFDQFVKSFFRSGQCLPISVVGYAYSSILNYLSRADVDPFYGATILKTDSKLLMGEGATLGHYINLDKSVYEQEVKDFNSNITPLLVHEYGHFMQARGWGGTSALSGSVYSLFQSALQSQKYQLYKVDDVSETWVERDATSRGIDHLKDEINDSSMIYLNNNYPQGFFENRMLHNYFIPFSLISGIYNIFNPY